MLRLTRAGRQALLLDRYWSMLRRGEAAPPPADLEPDMAAFTGDLARDIARRDPPEAFIADLRRRLETQAAATAEQIRREWAGPAVGPNSHRPASSRAITEHEEQHIMSELDLSQPRQEPTPLAQRRWAREALKFAAAALVFIAIGAVLALVLRDDDDAEVIGVPTTPTPVASPTSVATPSPVPTQTAALTPTTALATPSPAPTEAAQPTPTPRPEPPAEIGELVDIPFGAASLQPAFGFDSVWVPVTSIANNATQLLRLDPRTNAVIATIDIGAIPQPSQEVLDPTIQVATSGDSVWVARQTSAGNDIARIDPATNQLVDSIPIDIRPQGLVADGGTLWVASNWDNTVVRVDPTTRQTVARIDVAAPGAIAFGSGSVWVTSEESGDLLRIDPATNALSATIPIGIGTADPDYEAPNGYFAEPFSVAAGEDSVWVADVLGDTLMRVDPATNQVVATLDLRAPGAVAVTDDAVYVCRTDIGQVEQIDPASNQIVAASEGTPRIFASIGVGFDAIWITGSIGVTRIDVGP